MRAYSSPLKLFFFGIVGIILIAAAVDVTFGHWLSTPPDSNNGVLTTRGLAQQRGDLLWGGAMVVAGVLLFGGAVTELIRRRPMVIVGTKGLVVNPESGPDPTIRWEDVLAISSGTISDPFDGSVREQLIIEMRPDADLPDDIPSITRDGDLIYIDAHDWAARVTDVALAAQGAYDHFVRMEAVTTFEPPSVVWETVAEDPEGGMEQDHGQVDPEEDEE